MTILASDGPATFNTELLNEPINPEDRFFHQWHGFRKIWNYEMRSEELWLVPWDAKREKPSGWPAVPLSSCALMAATDPSLGQRTTAHPSCIVIVAKAPTNQLYVIEADKMVRSPSQIIATQNRWWQTYPGITRWAIESVQFQAFFAERAGMDALIETGRGLPIVPIPVPNTQKPARIQSLQPDIENGYILLCVDGQEDAIKEIEQYPMGRDDDFLDALEMVRQIAREHKVGEVSATTFASLHQYGEDPDLKERDPFGYLDQLAELEEQRLKAVAEKDPVGPVFPIAFI